MCAEKEALCELEVKISKEIRNYTESMFFGKVIPYEQFTPKTEEYQKACEAYNCACDSFEKLLNKKVLNEKASLLALKWQEIENRCLTLTQMEQAAAFSFGFRLGGRIDGGDGKAGKDDRKTSKHARKKHGNESGNCAELRSSYFAIFFFKFRHMLFHKNFQLPVSGTSIIVSDNAKFFQQFCVSS